MATVGVDFFRVDRARSVRRLLAIAAVLVTVGATTIGAHLVHRIAAGLGHALALIGGMITLAGLVLGFGSLAMLLFENVYLLITEEGVVLHENGKETTIAWSELDEVRVADDTGFVLLARRDGPLSWFIGGSAPDVAAKLEAAKRKARHGLLKVS